MISIGVVIEENSRDQKVMFTNLLIGPRTDFGTSSCWISRIKDRLIKQQRRMSLVYVSSELSYEDALEVTKGIIVSILAKVSPLGFISGISGLTTLGEPLGEEGIFVSGSISRTMLTTRAVRKGITS